MTRMPAYDWRNTKIATYQSDEEQPESAINSISSAAEPVISAVGKVASAVGSVVGQAGLAVGALMESADPQDPEDPIISQERVNADSKSRRKR